jgi:CDP-2,3-bis-(O-geranylgeranyl)-sn-glycerol synthase
MALPENTSLARRCRKGAIHPIIRSPRRRAKQRRRRVAVERLRGLQIDYELKAWWAAAPEKSDLLFAFQNLTIIILKRQCLGSDSGAGEHLRFVLPICMQLTLILQFVALLVLANGTPVIAQKLLGNFLNQPLDGGAVFLDQWPLFGSSKTIRGIVLSVLITTGFAPAIELEWKIGLMAATTAMAGDLLSSFLKRRLKIPSSSRAVGLDQIPESLFPALACRSMLGLSVLDTISVMVIFFAGEMVLSPLLFK